MTNASGVPSPDENTPVQMDDAEVRSHGSESDAPDDFLNDAVSGSETTSDAAGVALGQGHAVHPDLDLDGADITESEGPDL